LRLLFLCLATEGHLASDLLRFAVPGELFSACRAFLSLSLQLWPTLRSSVFPRCFLYLPVFRGVTLASPSGEHQVEINLILAEFLVNEEIYQIQWKSFGLHYFWFNSRRNPRKVRLGLNW
jgi:hypothetical protein